MTSGRPGCTTAIGSGWNGSRSTRASKAPRLAPVPLYRPSLVKRAELDSLARPSAAAPRGRRRRPRAERKAQTVSSFIDFHRRWRGWSARSELPSAGTGQVVTCRLLGDDTALGDVLMKVVVEVVAAGAERWQAHGDRLAGLDGLFAVQSEALEFDRLVAR